MKKDSSTTDLAMQVSINDSPMKTFSEAQIFQIFSAVWVLILDSGELTTSSNNSLEDDERDLTADHGNKCEVQIYAMTLKSAWTMPMKVLKPKSPFLVVNSATTVKEAVQNQEPSQKHALNVVAVARCVYHNELLLACSHR